MNINALRLSLDFADLFREGYSQDYFDGNEGEWTKDNRIETGVGSFWCLDRMCVPRNFEFTHRLNFELLDGQLVGHKGVVATFGKALDGF
jgi:hypothetical protein